MIQYRKKIPLQLQVTYDTYSCNTLSELRIKKTEKVLQITDF